MATREGVWNMVDESGKEYDIRVYSTPLRGLSGTSKIYDFWWGDEVVNHLPDGTFRIRDSGVILTRVL